jgi:type VI secretion system protein ImpK
MREEIAELVYPILKHGLYLKEHLARGARPDFRAEQNRFRTLLKSETEAVRWPDFGGDGRNFLGIRYALACWLDEIFSSLPSEWGKQWSSNTLELALFNRRERSWSFWEEARKAEARAEKDALEGYYLCVMLGFRGDMRDRVRELHEWRARVEAQFEAQEKWPGPAEAPRPSPDVPPLKARQRFRRLLAAAITVLGISILVFMFWVVRGLTAT